VKNHRRSWRKSSNLSLIKKIR